MESNETVDELAKEGVDLEGGGAMATVKVATASQTECCVFRFAIWCERCGQEKTRQAVSLNGAHQATSTGV